MGSDSKCTEIRYFASPRSNDYRDKKRNEGKKRESYEDIGQSSMKYDRESNHQRDNSLEKIERTHHSKDRKKKRRKHKKNRHEYISSSDSEDLPSFLVGLDGKTVYTNESNPFNDVQLNVKFNWVKKRERDRKLGLSSKERREKEKIRRKEIRNELEKLRKLRMEREEEKRFMEEEKVRLQRQREAQMSGDWQNKEKDFHLNQAKHKSAARIRENRQRAIDLLCISINIADEPEIFEDCKLIKEPPYVILNNLSLRNLQNLINDISFYLDHETHREHLVFWQNMMLLANDMLLKKKALHQDPSFFSRYDRSKINMLTSLAVDHATLALVSAAVMIEIHKMMVDKSYFELLELESSVNDKLQSDEPVDIHYWETLNRVLHVFKAKAKIKNIYNNIMTLRLDYLKKQRRNKEMEKLKNELSNNSKEKEPTQDFGIVEDEEELAEEERKPIADSRADGDIIGSDENDIFSDRLDENEVELEDSALVTDALLKIGASYSWRDKYKPRKPRFFNRVMTGFEWNKYNQTHYDAANPPPKTIQGYKFNIFYPDLINKRNPPTYEILSDPESSHDKETVLVKFSAGPPYEDIAFRIINRPWEFNHRRGFKCSFDRDVLCLWFKFKKDHYKR